MSSQVTPYVRRAALFGLAATAVYCAMLFGSLARLESISGLVPFDMRPMGYGPDDARALLLSLGDAGRVYYGRTQLLLDTFYPVLMALTLVNLYRRVGRGVAADGAVRIGVTLSWMAAVFDYSENALIAAMLVHWDALPDSLVQAASAATIAKSLATSVAVAWLVGLISWSVWRHWRSAHLTALENV
tara:strand:- start:2890 stop:3450 length:561 start_codon:yes stop_codon:yes gene_type:complete